MSEESISQEFRLKNIDETRNYFIKEINQNESMSKKHKKDCLVLSYIEHLRILISFRFHFCFCFFSWYSFRNYEFYSKFKCLCNNCQN